MVSKSRFTNLLNLPMVVLMIGLIIGSASCSKGGGNTVAPQVDLNPSIQDYSLENGRNTVGIATAFINPDTQEIEIVPDRVAEIHINISSFLNSANCPGHQCLTLKITSIDTVNRFFYIDMELYNPTGISAYDVRIIVTALPYVESVQESWKIMNPDSYTASYETDPLWDEDHQWIDPFIAFEKEDPDRKFQPDPDGSGPYVYLDKEPLVLYVPQGSGSGAITLIWDVNWPDHCKDPYEISRYNQSGDLPVGNDVSTVYVECIVADWQEDVMDVSLYCPDIILPDTDGFIQMHEWPTTGVNAWPPGDGQPPFDQDEIDFMMEYLNYNRDTLRKYWCNITNENLAEKGIYDAIIVAKSVDTDWSGNPDDEIFDTLYQRCQVEVDVSGSGGDPTSKLQVVYASYDNGEDSDIYTYYVLDNTNVRLTNDGGRGSNELEACINAVGTQIAFISDYNKDTGLIGDFEVYKLVLQYAGNHVVPAAGDNTANWIQLTSNNYDDRLPDFSPDGTMVAYAGLNYGQSEIYTVQNVSSFPPPNPFRVTYNYGDDSAPNYDRANSLGKGLYFHSDRGGGGNYDIYFIDPTSKEGTGNFPTRLTWDTNYDGYPSSSSGSIPALTWQSDRYQPGNMDILYTDFVNPTVRLTETPALDLFPSFSRNGEWIAFCSDRKDDQMDIFRMFFDGSNVTRLTKGEMPDIDPCYGGG
jgi:Tol biopolymer transport system component